MDAACQDNVVDQHTVSHVAALLRPVSLPVEIVAMIFSERLAKPSLHFAAAHITMRGDGRAWFFKPWSNGTTKSGYMTGQVLARTCQLARYVARTSAIEPFLLKFDSGTRVTVDAATDLVCMVLPRKWSRPLNNPAFVQRPTQTIGFTPEENAEKLEGMLHIGLLVDKEMWQGVLANWFTPDRIVSNEEYYAWVDGRLSPDSLSILMCMSTQLQTFHLVLTDVSREDWESYYRRFPTAYHDHSGSYVQVTEKAVHQSIIKRLWANSTFSRNEYFPYQDGRANLNPDAGFEDRLDQQLHPSERISLLQGLLDYAETMYSQNMRRTSHRLSCSILVRQPTAHPHASTGTTLPQQGSVHRIRRALTYGAKWDTLGPEDPEEDWVKLALDRIFVMSTLAYGKSSKTQS